MTDKSRLALNITGSLIAVCVIVLFGGAIYALVTKEVPDKNANALLVLLGALTTQVSNIVSYFFGSSSGDKAKNDTIAAQSQTIQAATQAALPNTAPTVTLQPGAQATVAATPNGGTTE